MELFGAKFSELVRLMNRVAEESTVDGVWRLPGDVKPTTSWNPKQWTVIGEANICGVVLRLRQNFNQMTLVGLQLNGNGWMITANVTKKRPTSFKDDQPSDVASINLPPLQYLPIDWRRNPPAWTPGQEFSRKFCIHGWAIASQDQFHKEMALLRMFWSEIDT